MEYTVTYMEPLMLQKERLCVQQELLHRYALPVIAYYLAVGESATCDAAWHRVFQEGLQRLQAALQAAGIAVVEEAVGEMDGCTAFYVVNGSGNAAAQLCMELENEDGLSQLFRFDVSDPQHGRWKRSQLDRVQRTRLAGKRDRGERPACTPGAQSLVRSYLAEKDRKLLAAKALLYEVCTAPKPGLVDRFNNGSHRDMNLFTFLESTTSLIPYFETAVKIGQETAGFSPDETFQRLRRAGIRAEHDMFQATAGINTHKGAIFTLGTVCGAMGRLWTPAGLPQEAEAIFQMCSAMCVQAVEKDWKGITEKNAKTMGQRLYLEHGIEGIRGELVRGLPAVRQVGLPVLEQELSGGATLEQAGVAVLLHLMERLTDTNLIARGGMEGQKWAAEQVHNLLEQKAWSTEQVKALDDQFIQRNLSPGGCADLLAITYFMHFISETSGTPTTPGTGFSAEGNG
ncbi:triphosphoribosyl-dephospho-CoA synthase CitG [Candidatus Avoscillospira sp. LCP25S3_F1]|uniref:triphosphoribosyl-dephospho-CoA synthase CitG n=1 Tax=Candidatus Avoscillospira sp. LCP25S3_F1 TaxID=3438825 RepID=UPI003F93C8D1